jgi:predicted house-cleaning noncanonical NTP pyrophosphatase (MazG superfamily)
MPTVYNKLIRDRIPEIIQSDGKKFETEILSELEFRKALRQKLIEEAQEAAEADSDELSKEIADLYEVIDAIINAYGLDQNAILELQNQRRQERGGFERRLRLLWVG